MFSEWGVLKTKLIQISVNVDDFIRMCAQFLVEKLELFLTNLLFFTEKNALRLEGEPLAKLQDVCDQTKNLIEYTKCGAENNQMWQIEREILYDHLLQDYFEIIKEISLK